MICARGAMPTKYKIEHEEKIRLLQDLRKIFKRGDEREFMQILRKRGITDEDPLFSEIVKFFRDLRSGKK
jgi:hypothetical protein